MQTAPAKQKPALILGQAAGLSGETGFLAISNNTVYSDKSSLQPGIPSGAHLTNIRIQRTIVSIGMGGYMCPDNL